MSLKHSHSCGSLAAAEQLEALMRHPTQPSIDGPAGLHQRQLYAAGGMYSDLGMESSAGQGASSTCTSQRVPCDADWRLPDVPADYVGHSLEAHDGLKSMVMRGDELGHGYSSLGRASIHASDNVVGSSQQLGALFAAGGGSAAVGARMAGGDGFGGSGPDEGSARSSLSMLHYAGATALGGAGGPSVGGSGLVAMGAAQQGVVSSGGVTGSVNGLGGAGAEADGQSMQKRRFVWTADLHSRFEAAVNALGLDNAKARRQPLG